MAKKTELYALTQGDLDIFKRFYETQNPNYISDFYLRGENSGTWWLPGAQSDRWKNGYDVLHQTWKEAGEPSTFEFKGSEYRPVFNNEGIPDPSFHHHHGFIFQPWQLDVFNAKQRIRVIFGGFGVGKTVGGLVGMLVRAATIPGYRAVVLTPNSIQLTAIYNEVLTILEGTKFNERFVVGTAEKPYPIVRIGNKHVGGLNSIRFYPIGDATGSKKILTDTLDEAFIDQAEQLYDIKEIIRNIGSRFRGMHKGRPRMGKITFSANADENEELWDLFDEAEENPDRVAAFQPATWDNPFITDKQIADIKEDVGGDEESIRVHMMGGRPVTGGEHFNAATLKRCRSRELDEIMEDGLHNNKTGYHLKNIHRIGIVEWAIPPQKGHDYLVVADPGWGNPPRRNSPVILVIDYTGFPSTPASIVGFFWVFGNNSPEPWLQKYTECVETYRAYLANAFDATGQQAGYERLVPVIEKINAQGYNMGGSKKFTYLNHLKRMMAMGLFSIASIPNIFRQLSQYKLPDDNLRQDIVSAFLVAAAWLEAIFYTASLGKGDKEESPYKSEDRYDRNISGDAVGRYDRTFGGRR